MKKQVNFTFFAGTDAAFTMIAVKGGTFKMGSDEYSNEKPIHTVKLGNFWIGEYLVTQAVWKKVMDGNNPSYFKGDTRPVEQVSWNTIAHDFLPQLNALTEKERPEGTLFYLPTEAQWEYAARGGEYEKKHRFKYSGSDKLDEVGWYEGNSHNETMPVGLKLPNLLGIYDMTGNLYEWCKDFCKVYTNDLQGVRQDMAPYIHPLLCGSAYLENQQVCHIFNRNAFDPHLATFIIGFRLVLFASLSV